MLYLFFNINLTNQLLKNIFMLKGIKSIHLLYHWSHFLILVSPDFFHLNSKHDIKMSSKKFYWKAVCQYNFFSLVSQNLNKVYICIYQIKQSLKFKNIILNSFNILTCFYIIYNKKCLTFKSFFKRKFTIC